MRIIKISLVALTITGFGILQSCKQHKETELKVELPKVLVVNVASAEVKQALSYSGSIIPDNTTNVSFAISGTINRVAVNEGQRVSRGQFLASIDATEYQAALQIANASLNQSQDAFRRFDELYKKGSFPEKDYIEIKTKVAQAQATRTINQKRISDSRLMSPTNGIITMKSAEIGGVAAPGIPAFSIVKTDMVYAEFTVPESEIGNFKVGVPVEIKVPTLDRDFNGRVTIINPVADPVAKTFTLKVRLENFSGVLMPGMIIEVSAGGITTVNEIKVPLAAVVNNTDNIPHIYVVDKKKIAQLKRITLGKIIGNEVLVTDGLNGTETIVVDGQNNVKDGGEVQIGTGKSTTNTKK